MVKLEIVLDFSKEKKCGKRRGKRGKTFCELPANQAVHILNGGHWGRSKFGRWYQW